MSRSSLSLILLLLKYAIKRKLNKIGYFYKKKSKSKSRNANAKKEMEKMALDIQQYVTRENIYSHDGDSSASSWARYVGSFSSYITPFLSLPMSPFPNRLLPAVFFSKEKLFPSKKEKWSERNRFMEDFEAFIVPPESKFITHPLAQLIPGISFLPFNTQYSGQKRGKKIAEWVKMHPGGYAPAYDPWDMRTVKDANDTLDELTRELAKKNHGDLNGLSSLLPPDWQGGWTASILKKYPGIIYALPYLYFGAKELWHFWQMRKFSSAISSTVTLNNKVSVYFALKKKVLVLSEKILEKMRGLFKKNNIPLCMLEKYAYEAHEMFMNAKLKKELHQTSTAWRGVGLTRGIKPLLSFLIPAFLVEQYRTYEKKTPHFVAIEKFMAYMDCLLAKVQALLQSTSEKPLCIPVIIPSQTDQGTHVFFSAENMWYPGINMIPIKNSLCLGRKQYAKMTLEKQAKEGIHLFAKQYSQACDDLNNKACDKDKRNAVIVSPFGGGKTMVLSSVLYCQLLAQIGLATSEKACMSVVDLLVNRLHVTYEKGKNEVSNHIAELKSIVEIKRIVARNKELAIFAIIDELYSGTTEEMIIFESKADLEPIVQAENASVMLSTHFKEISAFLKNNFGNMPF